MPDPRPKVVFVHSSSRPPRSLATRLIRLFAIAALVLTGSAAQAQAAFTANMTTASPANTSAMQYSDFNLVMDFPADSTPKSLQLDLPVGQLGAVDSATVCSDTDWQNDNCATSAQIGEIATTVKALGLTLTAVAASTACPRRARRLRASVSRR